MKYIVKFKRKGEKEWHDDLFNKPFASLEIANFALICNPVICRLKKQGNEFKIDVEGEDTQ